MNSFLITFKPDTESPERGWPIKSLQKLVRRLERGQAVTEPWRFLNRRDASAGDRAFLLLQGKRGPAIIGYGRVAPRGGRTWKNIQFEALADPETPLLSKDELLSIDGLAKWLRTQASGVRLPEHLAAELEALVVPREVGRARSEVIAEGLRPADGIFEAPEGRVLLRKHFARERDRRLVESKRNEALRTFGKLSCEVCNLDFTALYGDLGSGVIECHHTKPIATLSSGYKTHIDDLALICANCHRVLHKGNYTISSLRGIVRREIS